MLDKKILSKWEEQHWKNILLELREAGITLTEEDIPRIIEETSFRVRSVKHPERCLNYHDGTGPCHPELEDMNCLVCACPNYISDRDGGGCKVNSPRGVYFKGQVWDCSNCSYGHSAQYAKSFLRQNLPRLRTLSETL